MGVVCHGDLEINRVQGQCTETDEIVLTVAPLPAISVSGDETVCPGATKTFAGPALMKDYSWSISGNGTISGRPTSEK